MSGPDGATALDEVANVQHELSLAAKVQRLSANDGKERVLKTASTSSVIKLMGLKTVIPSRTWANSIGTEPLFLAAMQNSSVFPLRRACRPSGL